VTVTDRPFGAESMQSPGRSRNTAGGRYATIVLGRKPWVSTASTPMAAPTSAMTPAMMPAIASGLRSLRRHASPSSG
jgi:hypothetical protein